MKNSNPAGRKLHMARSWQRLLSIAFIAFFAYLIWLAITGQYDPEVNGFAAWLHARWIEIRQFFH